LASRNNLSGFEEVLLLGLIKKSEREREVHGRRTPNRPGENGDVARSMGGHHFFTF
jgi:hypothetical protein